MKRYRFRIAEYSRALLVCALVFLGIGISHAGGASALSSPTYSISPNSYIEASGGFLTDSSLDVPVFSNIDGNWQLNGYSMPEDASDYVDLSKPSVLFRYKAGNVYYTHVNYVTENVMWDGTPDPTHICYVGIKTNNANTSGTFIGVDYQHKETEGCTDILHRNTSIKTVSFSGGEILLGVTIRTCTGTPGTSAWAACVAARQSALSELGGKVGLECSAGHTQNCKYYGDIAKCLSEDSSRSVTDCKSRQDALSILDGDFSSITADTTDSEIEKMCSTLSNTKKREQCVKDATKERDKLKDEAAGETGGTTDTEVCSDSNLAWIACPISKSLASFVQLVGNLIGNLLFTATDTIFTDEMRQSWNVFRNVGLALILIAGLVMVISQAAGLDILDAYTIRKLMPRLAIAVIGISLSWPLLKIGITLVNDLGLIAYDAIIFPFRNMPGIDGLSGTKQWAIFGSASGVALIVALFAGLDILGIILFLFTIVLAIIIGVVVLGIRQIVIIMGILLAPLAIAAYVLPGTQKLWSFWKGTMITTLAMFPIIMAFLAAGDAAARVALAGGQPSLLAVLLFFAPYFMLPFAFKLAGGLMTTIFSLANDRNRGLFDRLSKARQNRAADMRNRIAEGHRWQADSKIAKWGSRKAESAYLIGSGKAGIIPTRGRMGGRLDAARSARGTAHARKALENEHVQGALSDDFMIDAALDGDRTRESAVAYFRKKGDDEKTAQMRAGLIENAKKAVGEEAFFEAAVAANAGTKTGFAGGRHQLNEKINAIAGKDDVKRARMMASAREQAKAAGRVDLYGGSYGDSVDIAKLQQEDLSQEQRDAIIARAGDDSVLKSLKPGQRLTEEKVNELAGMSVLRNNSVWEVGGGYYIGTQNMQGAMLAELETAQNNYRAVVEAAGPQPTEAQQADIKKAQEEYVRVIARDSALTQIAGQTNGKNADIIGAMQGQNFISPTATYADLTNPANFQKKTNEKGEVVRNEKGEEVIVPITTLRDATLHAEMGVASYHNYVQSYYAQQVMGPALQQQQQQSGQPVIGGIDTTRMSAEQIAQLAAQQTAAQQMGGQQPPGGPPPPMPGLGR
ncbi:hypothetical protein KDA14_00835 [Candidatus Saccharibacteria bacterium]|nr:hypothetical protein [Candidatus Saccharibacteria bacterium]